MHVRVIGVGTPHGDDGAGPAVVEALRAGGLPEGVSVATCARPGLDLPDALAGAEAAVLVDAMRSGRRAGCVARVSLDALSQLRSLSSHGLGVADGLALSRALGRCPAHLEVVGIEADGSDGEELSAAVRRGVEEAVALVRTLLRDLRRNREA